MSARLVPAPISDSGDAEPSPRSAFHQPRIGVVLAFAAVYFLWGSTYLAIRVAIESLPPFLMAGARFTFAGAVLYLFGRSRGAAAPDARQWAAGGLAGALMLWVGNGGVVYAEHFVPSGLCAVIVATVPVWVALADWFRPGGARPRATVLVGLGLGLVGVAWLAGPGVGAGHPAAALGAAALIVASISWSIGTLLSRHAPRPSSAILGAALQMLTGGVLLTLTGVVTGEARTFDASTVTRRSVAAVIYLTVCGSLIAYTSYAWLIRVVRPTLVATYAFVNPVVAVLLGWALAGEELPFEALAAGGVVIAAVAIVVIANRPAPKPAAEAA